MQKRTSKTARPVRQKPVLRRPVERDAASVPHEAWLLEHLKDPAKAAAYLDAAIEDGDQAALMLALRNVARAHGGVAELARRSKLTREATYRMLSESGNPELRSFNAILAAAGLRLSVQPIAPEGRRKVAQACLEK